MVKVCRLSEIPPEREGGFVLVAVLWICGLLAVLAATLAISMRAQIRVTANVIESAKAEALAEAGVVLAVMDLRSSRQQRDYAPRIPVGDHAWSCVIAGEGRLRILISDAAGRIDINSAGIPLIQSLIAGLGVPSEKAARLAEAILDYRDTDDERMPNGAETAEYLAAGLGWGPKNAAFQTVDELGQVLGMTPEILDQLRPYVGVHSGLVGIDPIHAGADLVAILRAGWQSSTGAFRSFPKLHPDFSLPAIFIAHSRRRIYELTVEATTTSRAVHATYVVLDLGIRNNTDYQFLRWTRSLRSLSQDKKSQAPNATQGC